MQITLTYTPSARDPRTWLAEVNEDNGNPFYNNHGNPLQARANTPLDAVTALAVKLADFALYQAQQLVERQP